MDSEEAALCATARLFAGLLLRELDGEARARLLEPAFSAALSEVGVEVPALAAQADLDELAVQFLEAFLRPRSGGPLVQSLWTTGAYEGDCAVAIRKLAEIAGVEFDRSAARGAPHDHLGCILLLWAAVQAEAPEVAARLAEQHLAWAVAPLARVGADSGFYPSVARATAAFVLEITTGAQAERPACR